MASGVPLNVISVLWPEQMVVVPEIVRGTPAQLREPVAHGFHVGEESVPRGIGAVPAVDGGRMMRDHGMIGRRYAGKVKQIISGSIGFDD